MCQETLSTSGSAAGTLCLWRATTRAAPPSVAYCAPEQEKLLWLKGGGDGVLSCPPRLELWSVRALQQPPILRNFPAGNDGSERSAVLAPSPALL